jgi:hypothetical protein
MIQLTSLLRRQSALSFKNLTELGRLCLCGLPSPSQHLMIVGVGASL